MSNHDGGYMLNAILHGLVEIDILKDISVGQRSSIRELLWSVGNHYDCNWSEIIDADLAVLLQTFLHCNGESTEISSDTGYCVRCNQEEQQAQIRWGETSLLRHLLQHRFGSLPHWVSDKMQAATEGHLLNWGERLLEDTLTLEEVFSGPNKDIHTW